MQRRVLLRSLVRLIQAAIAAAVFLPGLKFLRASPLRRRIATGQEPQNGGSAPASAPSFIRVATLSSLSADQPTRVVVVADRWDAYTHYPSDPVGSVWLIRSDDQPPAPHVHAGSAGDGGEISHSETEQASPKHGGTQQAPPVVRCLQTICPHLGCGIDLAAQQNPTGFTCPCHVSEFDDAGRRGKGPSPRDMDELPCRVTAPDENGERWVEIQYVEFRTGTPEKRPIA